MALVCCIYHKAKKFGESSSEESSSDSDSECDHAHHRHQHHRSANGNGGAEKERSSEGAQVEELESDGEPNAYERPSGWKRNKGKRKANCEPSSFQSAESPLIPRSLTLDSHLILTMHTVSRVFRERDAARSVLPKRLGATYDQSNIISPLPVIIILIHESGRGKFLSVTSSIADVEVCLLVLKRTVT